MIASTLQRLRNRLSDESGYTMVVVMGVLLVATLFSVAALASADGDTPQSRQDVDRKEAYAAAEAGVNDYFFHLNQDSNWWTKCTTGVSPSPVNQKFNRTSSTQTDPRTWRDVPGSSDADYTIELIPAPGQSTCDPANSGQTMIDPQTRMFTVRATGRSAPNGTGSTAYRTITTSFRRASVLDFLYYTDYEITDPEYYRAAYGQNYYNNLVTTCVKYKRQGRPGSCPDITFVNADKVNGPLHVNDRLLIQGHPTFGRDKKDEIEVSAKHPASPPDGPAWEANGSGDPNPFNGTFLTGVKTINMPPTNAELAQVAGLTYTGDTEILFKSNGKMDVRNKAAYPTAPGYTQADVDPPANGVIYVKNGACSSTGYDMGNPYPNPRDENCGIVNVAGVYSRSLTIGSESDIVIRPDLDPDQATTNGPGVHRSGDAMLGLIANGFVRVYHPVTGCSVGGGGGSNASGARTDVRIDAAILSLTHSFLVDNFQCGERLGTLTVNGAIAQKFRGPVGTFGGGSGTGYTKSYWYDDRLKYRAPPYFLDPVDSRWIVKRHTEQIPAAR